MEDLKKLLAAATPGPWTHASDKLAAGNIKAPDNAALIVAAVNALPGLIARVEEMEEALQEIYDAGCAVIDALDDSPNVNEDEAEKFEDALHEARAALKETDQ